MSRAPAGKTPPLDNALKALTLARPDNIYAFADRKNRAINFVPNLATVIDQLKFADVSKSSHASLLEMAHFRLADPVCTFFLKTDLRRGVTIGGSGFSLQDNTGTSLNRSNCNTLTVSGINLSHADFFS